MVRSRLALSAAPNPQDGDRTMERAFDSGVGEYTVRIDYRDGCGAQATNCTVRVNQPGAAAGRSREP